MKRFLLVVIVSVLFWSCALESKYILPEKAPVNTELFGVWKNTDEGNGMLIVTKKSKTRYNIELIFDITKSGDNPILESYEVKIGDITVLNFIGKDKDNQQVSIFYTYRIDADTLYYKEVIDNGITTNIHSNDELLSYFINNINNQDFFGNEVRMKRVK